MKIQLSRIHVPVTALGYGRRIGIWVQGCSIGCAGCIAVDTWKPDDKRSIEVSAVIEWINAQDASQLDGVTISGGEPFEQPDALAELIDGIIHWRRRTGGELDILCYSGMGEAHLRRELWHIAGRVDVLIPEPFQLEKLGREALRGSDNQRIVTLTDLGRSRYTGVENLRVLAAQRENVQVLLDGESVWTVGIPFTPNIRSMAPTLRDKISLRRAR
jgi:anaerobic ribonucleoside-triphosphate reductase activating protein